jgi:PIN domain nuclease of toxin-antitoxin system
MAGRLWAPTRQLGLSLGDRACLSLGLRLGLTVLTCDRAWAQLSLDVVIQLLR